MEMIHFKEFSLLFFLLIFSSFKCDEGNIKFSKFELVKSLNILPANSLCYVDGIDGISDDNVFSVLIQNIKSEEDTIVFYSKETNNKIGIYQIKGMPSVHKSFFVKDSFALFLLDNNKVQVFKMLQGRYILSNTIEVIDTRFYYDKIINSKDGVSFYLSSSQGGVSLNDGFLKIIEVDYKNEGIVQRINQFRIIHNKIDSLNFLGLYKPNWNTSINNNGVLGVIDFEGNLKLIKDNNIYEKSLLKSDFSTKTKMEVIEIQKEYKRNPNYKTLEKTDELIVKHKRVVGLLLGDSIFAVTYHYYDKSIKNNNLPISFTTEFYKFTVDTKTKKIYSKLINIKNDSVNKVISKESSSDIGDYIDLSGNEHRFIYKNKLFIYTYDFEHYMKEENNHNPMSFYKYRISNKHKKLFVLRIS